MAATKALEKKHGEQRAPPALNEKKALLLLSGGIDSPVAGRLLQQQGWTLTAVHFSTPAIVGKAPEEKASRLADVLQIPLTIIDVSTAFHTLATRCRKQLYFVLSKRLMVRTAELLAACQGASMLVTGESVGQVSSQTLRNLHTIDVATSLPVLRPLIGLDKEQIILLAKQFGTYDLSVGPEFCDALGPPHPATFSSPEEVEQEETWVDARKMAEELITTTIKGHHTHQP